MQVIRPWLAPLITALPLILSCGKGGIDRRGSPPELPTPGIDSEANENNADPATVAREDGAPIDTAVLGMLMSHFKFTQRMDADIINFLRYDFGTLASWSETQRPEALSKLSSFFGLAEVNSQTLSQWLMERITYIYPDDNEPLRFAFIVPKEKRIYQLSVDTGAGQGVAASNIGGGLYSIYLDQRSQGVDGLLMKFNDSYLPFLSPRTGVMQIGPNFFDKSDSLDTKDPSKRGFRTLKSIYRLSVLFHEARHSDGNAAGETLSFAHVTCPADGSVAEEYEGLPACDDKSNGAYAFGGKVLKALESVCDGVCSARELSVLESIQLDVISRLVVEDTEANYGDPNPEPALTPIDTTNFEIIAE